MQKLHLVGVNLTRDGLIFTDRRGANAESFLVPVDAALGALVADLIGDAGVPGDGAPLETVGRSESSLSVREIQARLRSGRSIEEIAQVAGVSAAWIERFAPPVRAEQQQIISRALATTYHRPRLGPSIEPLGRAVAHHLAAKGARLTPQEFDEGWSTHHRIDQRWIVQHQITLRGRRHTGTWEFDAETGALEAADRRSLDLGYVSPGERTDLPDDGPDPTPPPSQRGTDSSSDADRRAVPRAAPRTVPPASAVEPDDGWSGALEWLDDNDPPRERAARPRALELFSSIEDVPDTDEPRRVEPDDAVIDDLPAPPAWLAPRADPDPGPGPDPDPEPGPDAAPASPADPLGFLSDDAVQAPARINADRVPHTEPPDEHVEPDPAEPDPAEPVQAHPAPDRDPAAPDRPTPHRTAPSSHRRNRPLRAR